MYISKQCIYSHNSLLSIMTKKTTTHYPYFPTGEPRDIPNQKTRRAQSVMQ